MIKINFSCGFDQAELQVVREVAQIAVIKI
jgi:hypothetical protein